jgi:hypothetical protein
MIFPYRAGILAAALLLGLCAMAADDKEIDAVVKARDAIVEKANRDAVKKLERILSARTKKGDLDGALKAKALISRLSGEAPEAAAGATDDTNTGLDDEKNADWWQNDDLLGDTTTKDLIGSRYLEFAECLIRNDTDAAFQYLDPNTRAAVPADIINGYLKIMAGHLNIARIGKKDIRVKDVVIGVRGDEARLVPAFKGGNTWESQKPIYMVKRKGKWYIGDEKALENFK